MLASLDWMNAEMLQSETLKYLYLLFADESVLPLSSESIACLHMHGVDTRVGTEYVLNTEVRSSPTKYTNLFKLLIDLS